MTNAPPPYADRIARVRLHIAENLTGDLTLDRLADVAALSRFHFHRVFAAMTDETVAEAVRRARLNRAAVLMVGSRDGLPRVARACGYPNPQSFALAFAAAFGATGLGPRVGGPMVAVYHDSPDAVPVADLREHAGVPVQDRDPLPEGFGDLVLPGGRMAVLTMRGPYSGLAAASAWLYGQWLPGSGEEPGDAASFEVYPNNPMTAAPAELTTEICVPLR